MMELAEMVALVVLGWTLAAAAAAVDSTEGESLKDRSLVLEMEAEIGVELDPQSEPDRPTDLVKQEQREEREQRSSDWEQEGTQSQKEEDLD
jgi:hypothetical protein